MIHMFLKSLVYGSLTSFANKVTVQDLRWLVDVEVNDHIQEGDAKILDITWQDMNDVLFLSVLDQPLISTR